MYPMILKVSVGLKSIACKQVDALKKKVIKIEF